MMETAKFACTNEEVFSKAFEIRADSFECVSYKLPEAMQAELDNYIEFKLRQCPANSDAISSTFPLYPIV